jgi:hypothetical protein
MSNVDLGPLLYISILCSASALQVKIVLQLLMFYVGTYTFLEQKLFILVIFHSHTLSCIEILV